jgi:hypothetical protein
MMAKGDDARIRTAIQPPARPAIRRPANHIGTKVATERIPESDRTARLPVPNTSVQTWSRK